MKSSEHKMSLFFFAKDLTFFMNATYYKYSHRPDIVCATFHYIAFFFTREYDAKIISLVLVHGGGFETRPPASIFRVPTTKSNRLIAIANWKSSET